jgi:hypothetical protein
MDDDAFTTPKLDGIVKGFDAYRERFSIDVHDEDGERLFGAPVSWTPNEVNFAIGLWRGAFRAGEAAGRAQAQREIRAALGFGDALELVTLRERLEKLEKLERKE